jgi:hypothetical protein
MEKGSDSMQIPQRMRWGGTERRYKLELKKKSTSMAEGAGETIYSVPGCQKDPMRPLAEFTMSTARPTSPGGWFSPAAFSDLSSGLTPTSTGQGGTGNNALGAMVGELAGVGFLDLWASSSSGIAVGITIGPVLLDLDDR